MVLADTIAAISTAMSNSGIGIVRISGEDAISIIDKIFKAANKTKNIKEVDSYTAHYGNIVDDNVIIDECIVLIMKGPKSYTREDVVEINCHGGVVVTQRVLETVLKYGARPADPGEFTKRAFLNGRIDLSQAEAVIDLINAKNEFALDSSLKQLKGSILAKIKALRKTIINNIAFIESALDDPEHYSVDGFGSELEITIDLLTREIESLISSADNGRIRKEGIKTVIIGKPNAGKSSLLNVLLGEDRAIVTEIAGTTRDTLEESIQINGIPLNIIDTAGIRNTEDIVEKIGVEKAKSSISEADLILYVVDGSSPLDQNDEHILSLIQDKKVIILLNKVDLNIVVNPDQLRIKAGKDVLEISAKMETGLNEFHQLLKDMFFDGDITFNDEIYITNIRHKNALSNALKSLGLVKNSIENQMPEDFYSIDLMSAYESLGYIIGESVDDDLVNEIFAEFCMGK